MRLLLVAALVVLSVAPAGAQVSVAQDLAAVITLHGQPCGTVRSVQKRRENDYVAACSSGQSYHVYVDGRGRTQVDKR